MDIFISWSGERSRVVAQNLREWIPGVLQMAKPWLSEHDIESGARWVAELGTKLQSCNFGIVCLTQENQIEPWIMFESGALTKHLEESKLVPYLFEMESSDVRYPLGQFQSRKADENGTERLISSINNLLGDQKVDSSILMQNFQLWWPMLEKVLGTILPPTTTPPPQRTDRELIEETLSLVRDLARHNQLGRRATTMVLPSWQELSSLADSASIRVPTIITSIREALNKRCPRCEALIDLEFQNFCSNCGHNLQGEKNDNAASSASK
jgi:hypothetical protein